MTQRRRTPSGGAARYVHLTPQYVQQLVTCINEWDASKPLTWGAVVTFGRQQLNVLWTRQTLAKNDAIRSAYEARRQDFRKGRTGPRSPKHPRDQQLAKLKNEYNELQETLKKYDRLLITYIRNATRHGWPLDKLEQPLDD